MNVTIYPSKAAGPVSAPPSKSVAHRALICGALSDHCTIEHLSFSKDIQATLSCLCSLGAVVTENSQAVTIGRCNPFKIPEGVVLDCGESGSTLRFLLPLCLLSGQRVTLRGHGRLMQRPLTVYEDLCRENGFLYEKAEDSVTVCGRLMPGYYRVPGNVSSQFITGLIYALSLLPGESRLEIVGWLESASYIAITQSVMADFGVKITCKDDIYIIPGNAQYSRDIYTVEGDCSNAAFLDGFNLLGGSVKVNDLTPNTSQGDWIYQQFYEDLRNGIKEYDLSDCPDLGPVMFALAAACDGATFTGTARLRLKESDRVLAMSEELAKFGIQTRMNENTFTVYSGQLRHPEALLSGNNDHRIVMALSLLCSVVGGTIIGADAVGKSYPDYFDVLKSLGIEMRIDDI